MTAAEKIVEYVRINHNSRSDKLMKLIAEYDVERAIADPNDPSTWPEIGRWPKEPTDVPDDDEGDGEPSRLGVCSNWFPSHQGGHARRDNCVDWRSGAAQEVSPPATGTSSDPRTGYLKQEEVSPPSPEPVCPMCCKPVFTDRAEGDTRELKAALRMAVKWEAEHRKNANAYGFHGPKLDWVIEAERLLG